MGATTLVLWDIDHTLIDSRGVGGRIYAAAFEKVTGRRLEHMAELSGRTEPVIFRETLQLHGIDDPGDLFDRFAQEQARGYAEHADKLRTRGRVLPGAIGALSTLAGRDDVIQSVLTGNIRASARIKLATSADLDEILRQTRHLLLDFDGPVCTLYPDRSAARSAKFQRVPSTPTSNATASTAQSDLPARWLAWLRPWRESNFPKSSQLAMIVGSQAHTGPVGGGSAWETS